MQSNDEKRIHDKEAEIHHRFGDSKELYHYLFETLDNFYYRYLERELKTTELAPGVYGARASETDMMTALKIKNQVARPVVIEYAKTHPKETNPQVDYELSVKVNKLEVDSGNLVITARVLSVKKEVVFKYSDLHEFRKGLALKLEEASELFL